jgi:hypothetical protein
MGEYGRLFNPGEFESVCDLKVVTSVRSQTPLYFFVRFQRPWSAYRKMKRLLSIPLLSTSRPYLSHSLPSSLNTQWDI